eukprot:406250_1
MISDSFALMSLFLNPFDGTLCEPFYRIWLLILITWISVIIELFILYRILLYRNLIVRTIADTTLLPDSTKRKLNKKVYDNFENELNSAEIEVSNNQYRYIPPEIVGVIMSMLPKYHDLYRCTYWMARAETEIPKLYNKLMIVDSLKFIYPIIRVICNLICFIIILVKYSHWHKEHSSNSNWEKYMSFVIALLYVPVLKLRAPMKIMCIPFGKLGDWSQTIVFSASIVDATYIGLFITVSIPIFLAGIFIFIPSVLLMFVFGMILTGAIGLILNCLKGYGMIYNGSDIWKYIVGLYDDDSGNTGFLVTVTFLLHWWFVTVTVSTIVFYMGRGWIKSYEFGFYADYCNTNEYFNFSKWNMYSWDVRFLVACWIIF